MKSKGDQRELNQREPHIEMIARADREPLKADHNGPVGLRARRFEAFEVSRSSSFSHLFFVLFVRLLS